MKKGMLYILLSTLMFSTMEIALKVVSGDFNPIQITFLRFIIGGIILFPLALKGLRARNYHLQRTDFTFFALTGFICVIVSMILYQMAILSAQASVVAVLFSCNPLFVILFAFGLLREKIYMRTVVSLLISMSGIIVIMDPLHLSGNATGFILAILAAVTFALYSVIGRKRSKDYGGVALTCFSFLFGSLEMLILIFITRISGVAAFFTGVGLKSFAAVPILQGINGRTLPALIYIGIGVTGLGYAFYFLAMEETSTATASLVFFIKPALAPLLALLLIHEPITAPMAVGIVLILAGSLVSLMPAFKLPPKKGSRVNYQRRLQMSSSSK
ncbi:DMT family transporter [Desulfosporosinus sp. PR]|uniref:DMT family transporter n=1 Tax=Candidatus Desulfosporosinus nitrosoreducens TaxID=3401928 RepID=UPI0027EC9608|nr:DMT family transporter [Desulfosporosinus sp. PR]MDQ7096525.1 DMT family transporter [Desulfosporosinus sp. PR]